MKNWKEEGSGLKIKINKQLILESSFDKRRMVVIKGNPKYYINPQSDIFYQTLKDISKEFNFKYEEYESNIRAYEIKNYKTLSMKDVVIGFSRGCGYANILKNKLHVTTNFIGIGCYSDKEEPQDYQIRNILDKTQKKDMSTTSIKNHWIITSNMRKELEDILRKI